MASFWLFSATFIALIACNFSLSLASSQQKIYVSTISAAPTVLPYGSAPPPLVSSPTLSPDIEPLFPTPGGAAYTPSESSLPTIPSSPSPPNPDSFGSSSGSVMAFPPSGSMGPAAAPTSHASSQQFYSILHMALAGFCIMLQFHGM